LEALPTGFWLLSWGNVVTGFDLTDRMHRHAFAAEPLRVMGIARVRTTIDEQWREPAQIKEGSE